MMIGLLAVVCVVAVFAPNDDTNENTHVETMLSDTKRDTWEYTCFGENLRTLDVLGA